MELLGIRLPAYKYVCICPHASMWTLHCGAKYTFGSTNWSRQDGPATETGFSETGPKPTETLG